MNELKRIYGLDILRAAAILCVLYVHGLESLGGVVPGYVLDLVPDGVLLFFVLSGFLIGQILLKVIHKDTSFSSLINFWKRRWLRTLPAYFFVLIIIVVFNLVKNSYSITEYLTYFFFIQNIKYGEARMFIESWSLSVEEWFYLIVPIVLFWAANFTDSSRKNIVLLLAISIIIIITCYRIYLAQHITGEYEFGVLIRRTVRARIDSIMFGVLGAWAKYYRHWLWNKKTFFFWVGISITVLNIMYGQLIGFGNYTKYEYYTVQSFAVLALLPRLDSIKTGKGIIYKALTYISKVSYSLYLVHFTLFYLIVNPWIQDNLIGLIIFYLWAFVISYLLYRFIEKPFMELRDKRKFQYLVL